MSDYSEIFKQKIAALKVGDDITYKPWTISAKILTGKIEAIFRDADGDRVFDLGGDKFLVPADRILFPE